MSYQNPAFMIVHNATAVAVGDIVTIVASTLTDDSKRALIDSRQGELGSFTATGGDAGFSIDMAGGLGGGSSNRVVIPAGHTFDTFSVVVKGDDTSNALPSPERTDTIAVSGSGVLDFSFALATGLRWWGLTVTGSVAEVFSLGEYWMGERVAIDNADVQPEFGKAYEQLIAGDVIGGRDVTLELAPPRRTFSLSLRYVSPADADFTILEEVIRLGRSQPFWYWTPDDTDTGPYLVKLSRSAVRKQESAAPQAGIFYAIDLEMIEQQT